MPTILPMLPLFVLEVFACALVYCLAYKREWETVSSVPLFDVYGLDYTNPSQLMKSLVRVRNATQLKGKQICSCF